MAFIVVSALVLTLAPATVLADAGSDAAESPMTVSLFDSQGSDVRGDLLDADSIKISTHTDWDTRVTTYTIESLTPLISDTRYLLISPENAGDCTLTLTAVMNAGFILETGITFAFYTDTTYSAESYVGELTYTDETEQEQTLNRLLTAGKSYYIRAWTTEDYSATEIGPSSYFSVDLKFVATTASEVNAVFYHLNDGTEDDVVSSRLVVNGQVYGAAPEVSVEGWTLVGWFTDPALGTVVHQNDTVELADELHLYAHWVKQGSDVIHVDENENDTWIWIDVTEDTVHVRIEGESYTSRVVTTYDAYVVDGKVIVDTHNTASDFLIQDAKDANEQYTVVERVLTEKGLIVENYIVISYYGTVSCEEGSLAKLLETDCNDFRVIGDALSISLDRKVIEDLSTLTGETVIETVVAPAEKLTEEQKAVIVGNTAYEIRITNNGQEIETFNGIITAWFPYDAPSNMSSMQVYSVAADGSVEPIMFTYEDGMVTFKTGHLSVFYVDVETSDDPVNWWPLVLIVLIVALCCFLMAGMKKKHKEEVS